MCKVLLVLVLVVLDCHAADDDAPPDVPELHTAVGMFEFNFKTMPMHSSIQLVATLTLFLLFCSFSNGTAPVPQATATTQRCSSYCRMVPMLLFETSA